MRCPKCTTLIPHAARYCPTCGERAPRTGPPAPDRAADALPSRSPIPRTGRAFLLFGTAAAALVGVGLATRVPFLIYVGGGLAVLLALFLILGDIIA